MIAVLKYPLQLDRVTELELPAHAEILTVQIQGPRLVMWARVDTEQSQVCGVKIFIVMTGESIQELLNQYNVAGVKPFDPVYINTVQDPEIGLVYHMFYTQTGPYIKK